MSQYKALALDIDGTLLNTKKEVTPEVLKEVRRLQEESVPVMIAFRETARRNPPCGESNRHGCVRRIRAFI